MLHARRLFLLGVAACIAACGGQTHESAAAAHEAADAGAERDAITTEIAPADSGCSEPGELPVIATADQFGPDCTFVGMIDSGLYVECTQSGVRTRIIAMLLPGVDVRTYSHPVDPNAPPSFTLAAASAPDMYLGSGWRPCGPRSAHVALLCDGEGCRVYELAGDTFMPAAVAPLPTGDWRTIEASLPACSADGGIEQPDASLSLLWVRSESQLRVASWDGAAWQVQPLPWPVPPPLPACLRELTIHNTDDTFLLGLTAGGAVIQAHDGRCCPATKPIAGAFDAVMFQCGMVVSFWVLTPTTLRGTFDCSRE